MPPQRAVGAAKQCAKQLLLTLEHSIENVGHCVMVVVSRLERFLTVIERRSPCDYAQRVDMFHINKSGTTEVSFRLLAAMLRDESFFALLESIPLSDNMQDWLRKKHILLLCLLKKYRFVRRYYEASIFYPWLS